MSGWWPSDWGSGGYYGYAYPPQAQAPPPEPQVIVISQDGQGRMKTAETPANYSYVKGCHAIANESTATRQLRRLSAHLKRGPYDHCCTRQFAESVQQAVARERLR